MRCWCSIVLLSLALHLRPQVIKSIIYDFDGFDLGATTLPEGDYAYGDLTYEIASNPLAASDVLSDRVLKLSIDWTNNYGAFGRGITRYLQLSASQDRLNFYFYNPVSNSQAATIDVAIGDDDNKSQAFETGSDDKWVSTVTVAAQAGWQLISLPLSAFGDNNAGGNGIFDIAFTQDKGVLLLVELRFNKPSGATVDPVFYLDMVAFSQGAFPKGSTALAPPAKQSHDHCLLGAHQYESPGQYYLIPDHFEGSFPYSPQKKLRYVNTYMQWASSGTTPNKLPGLGYQILLDSGYRPIITWEPLFSSLGISDPGQPSLSKIIAGNYDSYLDDFGDELKSYDDTIIVRLMHEFDGDWYPWCIATNQQDPQEFIQAWRHIVDRVRSRGANKVQWMWCPNSDFAPQAAWNWVVDAYPGNSYVDIVATDVYNSHYPASLPWWRSFRWQTAEIYYYLTTNFPSKPFFLCELASRERTSAEPAASQSKAQWFAMMDKDLQSYFRLTRALIFFNENKSQSWAINTSTPAFNSIRDNIWADDYYFMPQLPVTVPEFARESTRIYPNPVSSDLHLDSENMQGSRILSAAGAVLLTFPAGTSVLDMSPLPDGVYFLEVSTSAGSREVRKMVKAAR